MEYSFAWENLRSDMLSTMQEISLLLQAQPYAVSPPKSCGPNEDILSSDYGFVVELSNEHDLCVMSVELFIVDHDEKFSVVGRVLNTNGIEVDGVFAVDESQYGHIDSLRLAINEINFFDLCENIEKTLSDKDFIANINYYD